MTDVPSGFYPDPTGRNEWRFWHAGKWQRDVSDGDFSLQVKDPSVAGLKNAPQPDPDTAYTAVRARGLAEAEAERVRAQEQARHQAEMFRQQQFAAQAAPPAVAPRKRSPLKSFAIGVFIFVGLYSGLYACGSLLSDGPDDIEAFTICQQFVEERLKSSGSADFPAPSLVPISNVGDRWTVQGYVDAENSFGASLRRSTPASSTTSVTDSGSWCH